MPFILKSERKRFITDKIREENTGEMADLLENYVLTEEAAILDRIKADNETVKN